METFIEYILQHKTNSCSTSTTADKHASNFPLAMQSFNKKQTCLTKIHHPCHKEVTKLHSSCPAQSLKFSRLPIISATSDSIYLYHI